MARRRKKSRSGSALKPRKSYRQPPWPSTWDIKRGWCRFCGNGIIENGKQNKRKRWHTECGELWFLMNNPSEMRRFIIKRDGNNCHECEKDGTIFILEADHEKPLIEANGDYSYYHPDNVRMLCQECHLKKTKSDMEKHRVNRPGCVDINQS